MMKVLFIISFLFMSSSFFGRTSFKNLVQKGRGRVEVGYYNFSTAKGELNEENFEYKIMELFFTYVENKYKIKIKRYYKQASSFSNLYNDVKKGNLDFAYCAFSITEERKKEVNFSPPYMPNVEVLISNEQVPVVLDSAQFSDVFGEMTALYLPGTTYEEDILNLKNKFPYLKIEPAESSAQIFMKISLNPKYFGYLELQQFFKKRKELDNIRRQSLYLVKREGFGFIYPKNSDWTPIVNTFFAQNWKEVQEIVKESYDKEMIEFLDVLGSDDANYVSLMLLTKEKELAELKNENSKLLYDNAVIENKKNKEYQEKLSFYLYLLLLVFFLLIVIAFVAYRIKAKHSRQMQLKNKQLAIQKEIVEKKHKEIKDSITYAKRIQNALLQDEEYQTDTLPPHFIYFEPKDVVSGDFYWGKTFKKHFYISVTDCTGHGVPGGFMSVLGIAMFNEIIRLRKSIPPNEMLNILREKIILELDQSAKSESSRDGMNTALIKVNRETLKMEYAGAYHSVVVIRNGELIELKTNKEPIGFTYKMSPFQNFEFQLEEGDMLYMYSDGYADQFGGEKGKKFKSRNLKNLLKEIHQKPLEEQKEILKSFFLKWKGEEEQVDDVTVFGMRMKKII